MIDKFSNAQLRYFSHSSQLSISSWSTEEVGALDRCGHCDNCVRPGDSVERKDVTLYTWQILKIVDAVRSYGGKVTLGMLATLARGGNKGAFEVNQGRKKPTSTEKLDLDAVAGGPVDLNKSVCLSHRSRSHLLTADRTWSIS